MIKKSANYPCSYGGEDNKIEKKVVIGKFKIGFDNKVWVETEPNYYDSIQLNLLLNLKK